MKAENKQWRMLAVANIGSSMAVLQSAMQYLEMA